MEYTQPKLESERKPPVKPQSAKQPFAWKLLFFQWVVAPLIIAMGLIIVGAHLGANGPDEWYTRLILWLFKD